MPFKPLPLAGLRIVVTRAEHQAQELAEPLRSMGATVDLLPLIAVDRPKDIGPLQNAAANADRYDWIIFTSSNSIAAFAAEVPEDHGPLRSQIATVGNATRQVAEEYGLTVRLTPPAYVAESLIEAFGGVELAGRRVLIPSAAKTRDLIPQELRRLGAQVDVVEAYRNVIPPTARTLAEKLFKGPVPDWFTFASSSAADHLFELGLGSHLQSIKIATIGPITSHTVRHHGCIVTVEASEHTARGIVHSIVEYLRNI